MAIVGDGDLGLDDGGPLLRRDRRGSKLVSHRYLQNSRHFDLFFTHEHDGEYSGATTLTWFGKS